MTLKGLLLRKSVNLVTQTETKLSALTKDKVINDDCNKPIFQGIGRLKIRPLNITVDEKIDPFQAPT